MKKLLIALAFITFLAACGGEPEPKYTHTIVTDEGFTVHTEGPMNTTRIMSNLKLARELLVPAVIPTVSEFFDAFKDIPIYIRRASTWNCKKVDEGTWACSSGNYDATFGISLGGNMDGLLHEFLHAWETSGFVVNTLAHPDWESKGYYQLDAEFVARRKSPWT